MVLSHKSEKEARRLRALHSFNIKDTQYEQDYQNIVNLAAETCQVPISLISLVEEGRQWFKSKKGLDMNATPRQDSMCTYTIEQETVLVVPDAQLDMRFRNLPMVTGAPNVRFYAGAPLITDEGYALGALCVMDTQPRTITPQQVAALQVLARQAVRLMELRRSNLLLEEQNSFLGEDNGELYTLNERLKKSEAATRNHLEQIQTLQTTLAARERQYRELVENVTDMIYELDEDGRFIFTNPVMEKATGYSLDEFTRMTYWDVIHANSQRSVADFYRHQRKKREGTTYFEFLMITKTGRELWVGQNVTMFFDESGYVRKVVAVARDISALKSTEFKLSASERRFRSLSEKAPVGIFQTDAVGQCFYVNKRWCEITGLTAEQAVDEGWVNAIHPDDRTHVFANWMKAINESHEFVMEFRFVSGPETRWVNSHAIQIVGADGEIEGYIGTISDITELKTVQQQLSEREQLYRLISTNSRDIITLFTADKEPLRRFISPSVREVLGYEPACLLNKGAFDIVHPDDVDRAMEVTSLLISTGQPASLEYRGKRRDGQYVWLESKLNPIIDGNNRVTGILTAVRDISQRKAFEESLHLAKVRAEEATMAKSHFLSMMSHEIRTPMNAILGLTQLMLGNEPRQDQKDNLELLRFSGENLLTIINDILDFSKIEAGKIELEQTDFDVHSMLRSTVQMFEHKAWQKGIKLELTIANGVPKNVIGDPVRISQIVNNLVGNAIKFTDQGQVTVRVSGETRDRQRQAITFEVADSGIGIPEEKLKAIFDRFSQADSNTTRKFGGTGLGLSISKSLAELMGGDIRVESTYGVGSSFSFMVDLQLADQSETNSIVTTQTLEDFSDKNVKVLLVEDNKINQIVARSFLTNWGLHVDIAENGLEAVSRIESERYNIVLMDIQMPELDGYEATACIRKLGGDYYTKVPIIALTASAMLGMRDKVMEAGMNDFVTKPFVPEELNSKIQQYALPTV